MDSMKRLLFWLLEGTKGGATRKSLLSILAKSPMNARQLSLKAELDYKTVEHHLRLLEKNYIVESVGGGYGKAYYVCEDVLKMWDFDEGKKGGKNDGKKEI